MPGFEDTLGSHLFDGFQAPLAMRYPPQGISTLTLSLLSVTACMLKPEKVAVGAPVGDADVGVALVIMQSPNTTNSNDQSSPIFSCRVMSKRVPCIANAVSRAATSPMALTVMREGHRLGREHRTHVGALDRIDEFCEGRKQGGEQADRGDVDRFPVLGVAHR